MDRDQPSSSKQARVIGGEEKDGAEKGGNVADGVPSRRVIRFYSHFRDAYKQFSNFFSAVVTIFVPVLGKAVPFATSEHAFQAGKAVTAEAALQVANAETAADAKKAGGKGKLVMASYWEKPYDAKMWSVTHKAEVDLFDTLTGRDDNNNNNKNNNEARPTENKEVASSPSLSGKDSSSGWQNRDFWMFAVVWHKFSQHADLEKILVGTGDAILVEHTRNDSYWADGGNGTGQNKLGQVLELVRAGLVKLRQQQLN
jgi:ribA/ribD-fused uncharacterized protein